MAQGVGFIGLGRQGLPIARNLLRAGHRVTVHDLRAEVVEAMVREGAARGESAREVAEAGEFVHICVVDDLQLSKVVDGPDGALAGLRRGTVLIVHSTVSPDAIAALAEMCAERGAELVDAPVSGGPAGAENGTLAFMVGGSPAAMKRCRPLFAASGTTIHCGPVGMGVRAKLAHQVVIAGNRMAVAEGARLGLESGLTSEVLHQVLSKGGAQSRVGDRWFERRSQSHVRPLYRKDLELALALGERLAIALPAATMATRRLEEILP